MADSRSWLAQLKQVADGLSLSRFSLVTDDQACKESGLVGYRQSSSSKGNRNDRIVASSRWIVGRSCTATSWLTALWNKFRDGRVLGLLSVTSGASCRSSACPAERNSSSSWLCDPM